MTAFLQLALLLAIILLTAKTAGYLTTKIGQPSVLGELLVGLILGPSLINLTHLGFITNEHVGATIAELAEIGVLLLMFIAGIELHLSELARNTRVSAYAGILGVIIPVGLGVLVGTLNAMPLNSAIFLGLTLGATSVSISAQTLMEMKVLRSRVGLGLLGAAVFDDILVILLLSAFLALQAGGVGLQIILVVVRMAVFLALSVAFGLYVLPMLARRVSRLPISQGMLTFAIVIMLVYGIVAELLGGMAAITGTFLAGLMFARTPERSIIEGGLRSMAYSFFVPIFFVNIGLSVNLRELDPSVIWFVLIVSVVAILGKIIGSGAGARLGGFNWRESLQLGVGMVSRGEVGLIVGAAGLQVGLLNNTVFSAVIGTVLITTLVTPPLLRLSFNTAKSPSTNAVSMGNTRETSESIEKEEAT